MRTRNITPSTAYLLLILPWLPAWSQQTQLFGLISIAALCNLATLFVLFLCIPYKKLEARHWGLPLVMAGFFAAFIPGTLPHLHEPTTFVAAFSYVFAGACMVVIPAFSLNQERKLPLMLALGLGTAIALLGVFEFLAPQPAQRILGLFRTPQSLTAIDNMGRAASVFTQRNIFGCFCAMLTIGTLAHIVGKRPIPAPRAFLALVCLSALCGIVASTSKNAVVALAVGLGAIIFGRCSARGKTLLVIIAATGMALFFIALFSGPDFGDPYQNTPELVEQYKADSPVAGLYIALDRFSKGRLHLWKYWWNRKLHKARYVWKGIGLGQFRVMHWDPSLNAHSTYAQFLFEGGIAGFCALLVLLGYGAWLAHGAGRLPLFMTFLATLFFDHFFDYSLQWSVSIPWLLAL